MAMLNELMLWFKKTHITVTEIAYKMDLSCGSSYYIIHKDLRYHKICARWVPKWLTDENKWACVEMCMQLW
jgi:hypothetical protein